MNSATRRQGHGTGQEIRKIAAGRQREARLAAALRENLKKRKAQARERAAGAPRKDETASR